MTITPPSGSKLKKLWAILLTSLTLCSAPHLLAQDAEHGKKQMAIRLEAGIDPQQALGEALGEFGSQITHVVQHPDGDSLISVDMPGSTQQRSAMESALHSVTGVSTVEKNACYEYYPDSINPDEVRSLTSPPAPGVEDFCEGDTVDWDPAETTEGPGNTFHSTTREQQSEVRKTVGWTQTRTGGGGGSVPPEEPGGTAPPWPIEYDGGMACSTPGYIGSETPSIKVAIAYSNFDYPRPIPIQAIARDFDEMRWACDGCQGGSSSQRLFIEDRIIAYKWTLSGEKGSLNVPFKQPETDIQAKIDKLKEEIREASDQLEELKSRKKALEESRVTREKALEEDIKNLEAQIAAVEADLSTLKAEIEKLQTALDTAQSKLDQARAAIKELEGKIEEAYAKIQDLQDKLDGKPSAESARLGEELAALEERIKAKQGELDALKKSNASQEQTLRQSLQQASQNLMTARNNLGAIRQQVVAKQDEISAIENRIYSDPAMYDMVIRQARITRLGMGMQSKLPGTGGALGTLTQPLTDLAKKFAQAATPGLKDSALADFNAERDRLMSVLKAQCGGLDAAAQTECNDMLSELESEVSGLSDSLDSMATDPGSAGTVEDYKALDKARSELASLEASFQNAENQLANAEREFAQAQASYNEGLTRLAEAESRLATEITKLQGEAQALAGKLEQARASDEKERLANTTKWLDEIASVRQEIEQLEGDLSAQRLIAESAQLEVDELRPQLSRAKYRQQSLQNQLDYLKEKLAKKQAELAGIEDQSSKLDKEIKALEDKLDDLKEQLKLLMKQLGGAAKLNAEASGQQVFIIPPPLELTDGFDQATFDARKDAVAEKELAYEKARSAKAQLQNQAYDLLKGFTEQLWALRAANDTLEPLEKEISALDDEKKKLQNEVAHERSADVQAENEAKAKLEQEKTEKDAAVKDAESAEETEKKKVEETEKELDSLKSQIETAQANIDSRRQAFNLSRDQYQAKQRELEKGKSNIEKSISTLKGIETKLGLAQSAVSRASARDDAAATAAARAEVTQLQTQKEAQDQKVSTERRQLLTTAGEVLKRQSAYSKKLKDLNQAEAELRKLKKEQRFQTRLLNTRHGELKAQMEERLSAERELRKTEDDIKRQDAKIEKTKEDSDKAVDEDEDVKSKDEEIEDKKKDKEKAEQEKNKALNKLAALKKKRDEWETSKKKLDDEYEVARKALREAKDALKKFLEDSFNAVELKLEVTLSLDDASVDEWRKPDPERVQRTITIDYNKSRTPMIQGPDEDLEPPAKIPPALAVCNTTTAWSDEKGLDIVKPRQDTKVGDNGFEPATIALLYMKGEPLYHVWPPIPVKSSKPAADDGDSPEEGTAEGSSNGDGATAQPNDDNTTRERGPTAPEDEGKEEEEEEDDKILVHSATPFEAGAADMDKIFAQCVPGGGDLILVGPQGESSSAGMACMAGGEGGGKAVDITRALWAAPSFTSQNELTTVLNVPKIREDLCEDTVEYNIKYVDSGIQFEDESASKGKFMATAGLLGDAPTYYSDFDKENNTELRIQIFEGGQRGKPQQTIEWTLASGKAGLTEKPGADKQTKLTLKTDASGYSRIGMVLDEPYGKAEVTAKWLRGKTPCETVNISVIRPLEFRKIKVGFAPQHGWEQGEKAFNGNSAYEGLAGELPEDGPETAPSFVVGLMSDMREPVDEKKVTFSISEPAEAKIDPAEATTRVYGLAWSFATDVPEEAKLMFKAEIDPELRPVTEPPELEGKQSTETAKQFKIGPKDKQLTIETDEPFVPGEAFSGSGKLVVSVGNKDIPLEFKKLELQTEGMVVDEEGVATEGTVSWSVTGAGGKPVKFKVPTLNVEFTLETIGMSAGVDASIDGKVKIPQKEEEVNFAAVFGPSGFYGRFSNFPELEFAKVKLEKGAEVIVDMHREKDPEDLDLKGNWTGKGLVIVQAGMLLPESMKGEAEKPPKISVKNFYFNDTGLNGELKVDYTVSAKLGKVQFDIENIEVGFKSNELDKAQFAGKATLADPFNGAIGIEMYLDRESKYSFKLTTDKPVTAPSIGLTFTLRKFGGTYEKEVFTFEMAAFVKSETFSDINLDNFMFNSKGDLEIDVEIPEEMEIGKGFKAKVGRFKLKTTETEFAMSLEDAGFKFNKLLEAKDTTIAIGRGPIIEEFKVKIEGESGPVEFKSDIQYSGNTFEGKVDVKVKNVMDVKGIFILGSQKKENKSEFTYWYVELNSSVIIPLGNTGLNIIELGGGVGYNYDPPIGQAPGAVRNSDSFSLKAAIAIGNIPKGKVFAGRLTMVLVDTNLTLNGKVWLLDKESSLYGEGQLGMYWNDPAKLEGFVRMVIALADSDGKLLRFNGQVDFRYAGSSDWYVKSRQLEGAILERILADGKIDIKPGSAELNGNVRYDLNKEVSLAVVSLNVQVHLRANGDLVFKVAGANTSLDAKLDFKGNVDVTLETKVKNFDLARASLETELTLKADNEAITISGKADISWDTWVHSGSTEVNIGYSE